VLVGIAAGGEATVEPLQGPPPPAVVIGCPEDEPAARREDTRQLVEGFLLRGDVLDDLGADDAIEASVGERELEDGAVHERVAIPPRIPQLVELDIQTDT